MSEETSEGQQSLAAPNISTLGGSLSSSVNMANFQIPPPDILELNDGSLASNWHTWVAAWKNFIATLLAVIGKEANKVFRTFTFSSSDDATKIEPVIRKSKSTAYPGISLSQKLLTST